MPNGSEPYALDFHQGNETNEWYALNWTIFYPSVRNLVYFGHGSPSGIGYNQSNTNVSLTVTQITNILHTLPVGQTNKHSFRFVFLDGCSTAKGTLPEAFGILHKQSVPLWEYTAASMRPSVFCGWSSDKAAGFVISGAVNYDHINFITAIQTDMLLNGATIGDAYNYACSQPDVVTILTSQFMIYGCPDITFGAFNN